MSVVFLNGKGFSVPVSLEEGICKLGEVKGEEGKKGKGKRWVGSLCVYMYVWFFGGAGENENEL